MLNFPDAPTVDQIFTGPNGSFMWDGVKWIPTSVLSTDAPSDGSLYGRENAAWMKAVPLAGGIMTGLLTLSANPSANLGAATKQYVDGLVTTFGTPSANLGLTAIPGVATTAMRSDAAPALSVSIAPTWTAWHSFAAGMRSSGSTTPSSGAGLELLWNGTSSVVQSYDRGASVFKPILIQGTTFTTNCGGVLGGNYDVSGEIRATSYSAPASGAGIELAYNSGIGVLLSYDRTASVSKPMQFQGSSYTFNNTGNVAIQSGAAASSTTTGALTVTGGIGCGQQLIVGNLTDVAGTIRSTSQTVPSAGAGLELLYASGQGYIQPYDRTAGAYKPLLITATGYTFGSTGNVAIQATTSSSSPTTGALVVSGGVGVGSNLYVTGNVSASSNGLFSGVVATPQINNLANTCALASATSTVNANYNEFYDSSSRIAMYLGGTNDQTNYYCNARHQFASVGNSTAFMVLNSVQLSIQQTTASSSVSTGALIVAGGAGVSGDFFAKSINGHNAGTWAGSIVNTTASAGQAGMYVAAGAATSANDTGTLMCAYTDTTVSAYSGYVYRNGPNAVGYATSSDANLKTTIREKSNRGLDVLRRIGVHDFYWTDDKEKIIIQGMYAQELENDYIEAVGHPEMIGPDGKPTGELAWGIDYGRLTPLLTRAIQQLADKIDSLEARVVELEVA